MYGCICCPWGHKHFKRLRINEKLRLIIPALILSRRLYKATRPTKQRFSGFVIRVDERARRLEEFPDRPWTADSVMYSE